MTDIFTLQPRQHAEGGLPAASYSLILGDCMESVKKLPSASVDMVLMDPPYILKNMPFAPCSWMDSPGLSLPMFAARWKSLIPAMPSKPWMKMKKRPSVMPTFLIGRSEVRATETTTSNDNRQATNRDDDMSATTTTRRRITDEVHKVESRVAEVIEGILAKQGGTEV